MSESYNSILERMNNRENKKLLYSLAGFVVVFVAVVATSFMLLNQQQDVRQRASEKPVVEQPSVPDEILLKFKPGAKKNIQDRILNENGLTVKKEIKQIEVKVIKVAPQARDAVITALSHNPAVDFAEVNGIVREVATVNDPYFVQGYQWNMTKIQAPLAWDITTGSPSIPVAIVDTGIDPNHPDLQGKIIANGNFTEGDSTTSADLHGHGTHVAGIVGAITNNGIGVAGLGSKTSLINVKALSDSGSGGISWIANGIVWAIDNGAKVINLSLGGNFPSATEESAVNYAWNNGAVVVAAAGNTNQVSTPFYPAAYPNVIGTASTSFNDTLSAFSNFGDWVDVGAPGGNIWSTLNLDNLSSPGGYGIKSGTSMASPHVAGLAALVFTRVTDVNGDGLRNDEVRYCIESTADNIGVAGIGSGRINAYKAVQCTGGAAPADSQAPTSSISSPTSGSQVSGGINVNVDSADNVGVTKVDLYVDGSLFSTDTNSPYSFFLDTTALSNNNHTLLAKAYDAAGNTGSSSSVVISVSNTAPTPTNIPTLIPTATPMLPSPTISSNDTISPTISINSPIAGSTVPVRSNVIIQASASDNVGVSRTEFYVNGTLTCSDTSTPYSCSWKVPGAKNKSYTISAKAYDGANNSSTATINVVAK